MESTGRLPDRGRRVRIDMNDWTEIRRKVLVEGVSKRSIISDYRMGGRTLDKILAHSEPPGYRATVRRRKPKLDDFLPVIDEILEADKKAPPKQRHTARRIFERLRDEYSACTCPLAGSEWLFLSLIVAECGRRQTDE